MSICLLSADKERLAEINNVFLDKGHESKIMDDKIPLTDRFDVSLSIGDVTFCKSMIFDYLKYATIPVMWITAGSKLTDPYVIRYCSAIGGWVFFEDYAEFRSWVGRVDRCSWLPIFVPNSRFGKKSEESLYNIITTYTVNPLPRVITENFSVGVAARNVDKELVSTAKVFLSMSNDLTVNDLIGLACGIPTILKRTPTTERLFGSELFVKLYINLEEDVPLAMRDLTFLDSNEEYILNWARSRLSSKLRVQQMIATFCDNGGLK